MEKFFRKFTVFLFVLFVILEGILIIFKPNFDFLPYYFKDSFFFVSVVLFFTSFSIGMSNFKSKLFYFLDLIQGSLIGFVIGSLIFYYFKFVNNPEYFEAFSAPWYIQGNIILFFLLYIIVSIISLIIKLIAFVKTKEKD